MKTKVCTKCGKRKSLGEYGLERRCKDGKRGSCKECANAYGRTYRANNRERVREYFARRWQDPSFRKRSLARGASWRAKNKERHAAQGAAWYAANKARAAELARAWRTRNREWVNTMQQLRRIGGF